MDDSEWQSWSGVDRQDTSEWSRHQLPEILPDFIQGWYLFMDSGLDVMERNVLHAELRGGFWSESRGRSSTLALVGQ